MKIYLIEGVSGAGKTSVCEELQKRGFTAIEADEELANFTDPATGLPTDDHNYKNWLWDEEKFNKVLQQTDADILFICGGAMNKPNFIHHFTKIFTLHIDDETLKHRLLHRTNNDYGKQSHELEYQLKMNRLALKHSKESGTILIDATKSINNVVDEIVRQIN